MKTIIVYYSHSGNNAALATRLQKSLGCDIEELAEEKRRGNFTILLDILFNRGTVIKPVQALMVNYDLVILVAPIWNARIATPMRSFLRRHGLTLTAFAFITLCGGRKHQKEKIFHELEELCQDEPRAVEELAIHDLLAADSRRAENVSTHRVTEDEFRFFDAPISKFLKSIGAIHAAQQVDFATKA